jgi:magnesium-transporting ATPase (P-type)
VDVLCLDKTGTLTEPRMELDELIELAPAGPV